MAGDHESALPSSNTDASIGDKGNTSLEPVDAKRAIEAQNQKRVGNVNISEQGEKQSLVELIPVTPRPDPCKIIAEVRRCDWKNFINRFSEDEPTYVIEALVSGDQLGKEILEEASKRQESGYFRRAEYEARSRVNRTHNTTTWVQRVRIQSPALLQTLGRVTGYAWATSSYTFLHPFQYFIHYHDVLKKELLNMEEVDPEQNTASELAATPISAHGHSSVAKQLRCYIEFVESDILPRYQLLQAGLQDNKSLRVRFHELEYLFKRGDLVFVPDLTLKRNVIDNIKQEILYQSRGLTESTMYHKIWRVWAIASTTPSIATSIDSEASPGFFEVALYYLDYDGASYSPVALEFNIPYFEGEKDVRSLEVLPLHYARNASTLLEEYKGIGKMYTNNLNEWHMKYSGWTLTTDPIGWPITGPAHGPNRFEQRRPEYIDGEVIVDFREAYNDDSQLRSVFMEDEWWVDKVDPDEVVNGLDLLAVWSDEGRSRLVSCSHDAIIMQDLDALIDRNYIESDKYLRADRDQTVVPDGDDLALLPRRMLAYSLKDAKFVPVDVRYMKSLDQRNNEFSHLQLQEIHKQVIQTAVRSHLKRRPIDRQIESGTSATVYTQDFIRGKGRGLLVMLHGEPGTGKTATAEAVAQMFKRPLFPLSCGSLDSVYTAERQLDAVFRLSALWDCILLLDEADVFLSARAPSDNLTRNSLVSIFLRKLEYFNGILFLTTNRIGKIDQAISSRLHLILHYKRLKQPEIENVFRINIDRLRQSEKQRAEFSIVQPLAVVESDIMQFVTDHCAKHPGGKGAWNGRQIRNAFIIAAGIAHDEAEQQQSADFQPQLRYSHFKKVEKLTDEYMEFRLRVLGRDDARQALLNEERDDDYEGNIHEDQQRSWQAPTNSGQSIQNYPTIGPHAHGIFRVSPSAPRPQPGIGTNLSMPRFSQDTQPDATWGNNLGSSHGYNVMSPDMTMEHAQNFDETPFLPGVFRTH